MRARLTNVSGMNVDSGPSRMLSITFGVLLIVVGIVVLAQQWYGYTLPIDFAAIGWPVYVIVPGVVLLLLGLSLGSQPVVAVLGGIVTTVGLVLAYQSATDTYASWAYAWALVAPGAVGASIALWGLLHARWSDVRDGVTTMVVGVVVFLVGAALFEGAFHLTGERGIAPLARESLPVVLILVGVVVIVAGLWPRRRRERRVPPTPPGPWPAGAPVDVPGGPADPALRTGAAAMPRDDQR